MKVQEIQDVAIAEILNPTFALTRQFLAGNKVVLKEHVPLVEDVIFREETLYVKSHKQERKKQGEHE